MICHKCKKKIPDASLICTECGATQGKKSVKNKLIPGMIAGVILCLIAIIAFVLHKPTVHLNDYLLVTFEGYDTAGEAVIGFDTEKLEKDYGKKIESIDTFLANCAAGTLDKNTGLSNGDVVTYTWNSDENYALEVYGLKLEYSDVEFTVSGLKDIKTFDLFEGTKVIFEGISPYGKASISGKSQALAAEDFTYELDKKDGLSNGDTVTITASYNNSDMENSIDYFIKTYGMVPDSFTKTYTVEGLDSYVMSLDQITKESLKAMQTQAEAVYYEDVENYWEDDEELISFNYLGSYLLTKKDKDQYLDSMNNGLYLVYKAEVKHEYAGNDKTYKKTNDIYWYIAFEDLIINPDGEIIVDVANYETPNDTVAIDSGIDMGWGYTRMWYYFGYQTVDEMYETEVKSKAKVYNLEDNVDESISVKTEEE